VTYLAFNTIAGIIDAVRHIRPWGTDPSDIERAIATALSALVVLGFGIVRHAKLKDPEPPKERVPRSEWKHQATYAGSLVALGVGWMSLWLSYAIIGTAYILLSTVISLPSWSERFHVGLAWFLAISLVARQP
jgi:energy-converting hydrogenase Eha subunit A